jgi:hypothetical protein
LRYDEEAKRWRWYRDDWGLVAGLAELAWAFGLAVMVAHAPQHPSPRYAFLAAVSQTLVGFIGGIMVGVWCEGNAFRRWIVKRKNQYSLEILEGMSFRRLQ